MSSKGWKVSWTFYCCAVKISKNINLKKNWMKCLWLFDVALFEFFLMQTINNNRIELNRKKAKSPLLGISTIKYDSTWIRLSLDACRRGWAKQTISFHFFSSSPFVRLPREILMKKLTNRVQHWRNRSPLRDQWIHYSTNTILLCWDNWKEIHHCLTTTGLMCWDNWKEVHLFLIPQP